MTPQLEKILRSAALPEEQSRSFSIENLPGAEKLFQRWESNIKRLGGNTPIFEARLAELGLTRENAPEYLARTPAAPVEEPPRWGTFLEELLSKAPDPNSPHRSISRDDYTKMERDQLAYSIERFPIFPTFCAPFCDVAERWLQKRLGNETNIQMLTPTFRYLTLRLSWFAGRALALFLKNNSTGGGLKGETPEARYQYFEQEIANGIDTMGWFLEQFPVLARLLCTASVNWVDALVEMLTRFESDRNTLKETFLENTDPGEIRAVYNGLSDAHYGGHTVAILEFTSGDRIVYKPRAAAVDIAYETVVKWINSKTGIKSLSFAPSLDRGAYGWYQFLTAKPCQSREEVRDYFERQGQFLALQFLLCGSDYHSGNFIAQGAHPIPIDMEAMCAPGIHILKESIGKVPAHMIPTTFSVMKLGMLPMFRTGKPDQVLEFSSALTGQGSSGIAGVRPIWKNPGTDQLSLTFEVPDEPIVEKGSLPVFEGRPVPVYGYEAEVLRGFQNLHKLIEENREEFLSETGPLQQLKEAETRSLLRNTQDYNDILFWGTSPEHLSSGAAFETSLERLWLSNFKESRPRELFETERDALLNGDIPAFYSKATSKRLVKEEVSSSLPPFPHSAFEQIHLRVSSSDASDRTWQSSLIEKSLSFARSFDQKEEQESREEEPFLQMAKRIADTLVQLSIRDETGARWLDLKQFSSTNDSLMYLVTDPFLHSGNGGIALFLADMAALYPEEEYAKVTEEALQDAWERVLFFRNLGQPLPADAFNGLTGLAYAFTSAAKRLNRKEFSEKADQLYEWAPLNLLREPDVLGGKAGALLLFCHDNRKEKAREVADLLQKEQRQEGGWIGSLSPEPLLGIGHGAAGIALALFRAYQLLGEKSYLESAQRGWAYERSRYSKEHENWPDLQTRSHLNFMPGWCAGAPGIGLSRIDPLKHFPEDSDLGEDLNRAIAAVENHTQYSTDHICCGRAGQISFLYEAGRIDQARTLAQGQLERMQTKGVWDLHNRLSTPILPGLMGGVSGIGLTLLALGGSKEPSRPWILA